MRAATSGTGGTAPFPIVSTDVAENYEFQNDPVPARSRITESGSRPPLNEVIVAQIVQPSANPISGCLLLRLLLLLLPLIVSTQRSKVQCNSAVTVLAADGEASLISIKPSGISWPGLRYASMGRCIHGRTATPAPA